MASSATKTPTSCARNRSTTPSLTSWKSPSAFPPAPRKSRRRLTTILSTNGLGFHPLWSSPMPGNRPRSRISTSAPVPPRLDRLRGEGEAAGRGEVSPSIGPAAPRFHFRTGTIHCRENGACTTSTATASMKWTSASSRRWRWSSWAVRWERAEQSGAKTRRTPQRAAAREKDGTRPTVFARSALECGASPRRFVPACAFHHHHGPGAVLALCELRVGRQPREVFRRDRP